jgi:hypothetical protein
MSLFESDSYKKFIKSRVAELKQINSRYTFDALAIAMRIHKPYLSKVLNQKGNFTEDQLFRCASFLKLNDFERRYLELLFQENISEIADRKKLIANELNTWVPSRLADTWASQDAAWQRPVIEASDKALYHLAQRLSAWPLTPPGTEGYKKAEVTVGGVDTRDLSQQTMESKQPGLYFIGEVVDITGWLGGYNFQWAWASAHACAKALGVALKPVV